MFVIGLVASLSAGTEETDYLAIMLENQKVGYAVHTRTVADDKVTTTDHIEMTLGRGGQAVKVTMEETHFETPDGKPLGFETAMTTSGVEQKTTGRVTDGKALITRQAMGQAQELTVDWPADALLSEGLRLFQLKRGLTPGDSFEVRLFRPDMLLAITAQAKVGEKTKVDLLGRPLDLTEVELTMQVGLQQIVMTSYVDEQMKALKTRVPMMNMMMEMVACDKSVALRQDDIVDFLDKLSIPSPITLINLNKIQSITYILKPIADKDLTLPVSTSQAVEKTSDRLRVTVTKTQPSGPAVFPYKGDNPEALEALKPTDYLQCGDTKVIDLAKCAVGDANDAAAAARRIEAFVDGFITQKDLSVGYASAAEVAQTRQGDCSEHAVLAAAMCRAVGIPARIVCGVVYTDSFLSKQSIFGGHMWAEVWLGDGWYGLDATRSEQEGFGPGHIALACGSGDPVDFFGLVNTLGCFEIEKIIVNAKTNAEKTAPNP
jgi:hypothetical protein